MNLLCSECSTQLSKKELRLNRKYPIGKLYCDWCQTRKERKLIKKLSKDISSNLDFYNYCLDE
jgi:uncharacterized protein YlaI